MKAFKKVLSVIERIFSICVALGFGMIAAVVLIQVIARYIPSIKAPWTDEFGRLMFFYTMMFGAPLAFSHREYAFIDVIITRFHGRVRHIADALIYGLCSVTAAVIAISSDKLFLIGQKTNSSVLSIKMAWFYGPIIALFAFSAIAAAFVVLGELYAAVKGEE